MVIFRSICWLLLLGALSCSSSTNPPIDAGTKPADAGDGTGSACTTTAECSLGLICSDMTQVCAKPCTSDSQCQGTCDTRTGQCVTSIVDAGVVHDAGFDAGVAVDAGTPDAGPVDAGTIVDAGSPPVDAGIEDAGERDAGTHDAGTHDAGIEDAGAHDAGIEDAGTHDAGTHDAGAPDAGMTSVSYYCDICKTDMDCGATDNDAGVSSNGNYCLQLQSESTTYFCGTACSSNTDCPSGSTCEQIGDTLADGGFIALGNDCLPTSGICPVSGTEDAGFAGSSDGGYPAAFPTPPQVVNLGGSVLSSPELYPIFFNNDPITSGSIAPEMVNFFQQVGSSSYWMATSEYGVGPAIDALATVVNEAAPTTIDDSTFTSALRTWLAAEIPNLPAPQAGRQPLYVIDYPAGTTITNGIGTSCTDFGGYHSDMQLSDGTLVAYAVLPRCAAVSGTGLSQIQTLTGYASHELAEGSTDPYPDFNPAWSQIDATHFYFERLFGGGEIGDMCVFDPEAFSEFPDLPFTVQRLWSNASVKQGHDPCAPTLAGEVFFNAVPVVSDHFNFTWGNQTVPVVGVNVAVGQSVTIPVDFYSDGPTAAWSVYAIDYNTYENQSANMDFSFNSATGSNGTVLHLKISPKTAGPGGTDTFYLVVTQGSVEHVWAGVVNEN